MKLVLTGDLVAQMTLDKFPQPGVSVRQWKPASGPNYLVYDEHRDAPVGFGLRVVRKASIFIVEKLVAGKKMKIHVGLARGRKGTERPIDLGTVRLKAFDLVEKARKHGVNPKVVVDQMEASELTLGHIWDGYLQYLKNCQTHPIKSNPRAPARLPLDRRPSAPTRGPGCRLRRTFPTLSGPAAP